MGASGAADRTASNAVIIFVRLAIGRRRVGLRCHSTRPVSRSTRMPARGGSRKSRRIASRWGSPAPISLKAGAASASPSAERTGAAGTARRAWVEARAVWLASPALPAITSETIAAASSASRSNPAAILRWRRARRRSGRALRPRPRPGVMNGVVLIVSPWRIARTAENRADYPDREHHEDEDRHHRLCRQPLFGDRRERQETEAEDEQQRGREDEQARHGVGLARGHTDVS